MILKYRKHKDRETTLYKFYRGIEVRMGFDRPIKYILEDGINIDRRVKDVMDMRLTYTSFEPQ